MPKKHSAIRVQIGIRAVKTGKVLTRELLLAVLREWIATGEIEPGFHIAYIEWQHKGKERKRAEGQEEIRETLERLGRVLHAIEFKLSDFRTHRGVRLQ